MPYLFKVSRFANKSSRGGTQAVFNSELGQAVGSVTVALFEMVETC